MRTPVGLFVAVISILVIVYFSSGIFSEVDSTINVTGTDYENPYNATHNTTVLTLTVMNYIALLLMLFFIVIIAFAFMKYV